MSFLKHLMPTWKTSLENKEKANAAILAALDTELTSTEEDAISTSILMSLESATDEWLDEYGNTFGVIRQDNEGDDAYRQRIISYILLERGTLPAIKHAIQNYLNDTKSHIDVYEPFHDVFFLNNSKLNSTACLLGAYYTTAVIDITFTNTFPIGVFDEINKFKAAGVTALMTRKPKTYNPDATTFQRVVSGDPIQAALNMQANRDSVYLQLSNSDIIGYKRVYKMILARPLKDTEDVNNPPYPVVYYSNKPYCLIPTDKAVSEGARFVYVSTRLEGEDFLNQGYSTVKLYQGLVPTGDKKNTLLPSEVLNTGTLLLTDSRDMQERVASLTIEEDFMIELHN